ncbi:MAG: hypothetical protein ABIG64_06270 [Candidatus Omnitrophota bacterium]
MGRKKGAVLILVLWALGFLAVFAVYLGWGIRSRLDFLGRIETRNKLSDAAEAGIKQAIAEIGNFEATQSYIRLKDLGSNDQESFHNVLIGEGFFDVGYCYKTDDFLPRGTENEFQTMYGVCDVESKLNINKAEDGELFFLINRTTGLKALDADKLASCIIDWKDTDDQVLPRGAEDKYYQNLNVPYDCKNASFEVLEELLLVKGMDEEIFNKIKPYLTVYGSGRVNINTASRTVLLSLGLTENLVDKIVSFRCGEDNQIATQDDQYFLSESSIIGSLEKVFSLTPSEVASLSNLVAAGKVSTFSNIFLIESTGRIRHKKNYCKVECIFKKDLTEQAKKAGVILGCQKGYFN